MMRAAVEAGGAWINVDAQWLVLNDRVGIPEIYAVTLKMCLRCRTLIELLDVARVELLDVLGAAALGEIRDLLGERCDRIRRYLSEVGPTVSTAIADTGPDDLDLS